MLFVPGYIKAKDVSKLLVHSGCKGLWVAGWLVSVALSAITWSHITVKLKRKHSRFLWFKPRCGLCLYSKIYNVKIVNVAYNKVRLIVWKIGELFKINVLVKQSLYTFPVMWWSRTIVDKNIIHQPVLRWSISGLLLTISPSLIAFCVARHKRYKALFYQCV